MEKCLHDEFVVLDEYPSNTDDNHVDKDVSCLLRFLKLSIFIFSGCELATPFGTMPRGDTGGEPS